MANIKRVIRDSIRPLAWREGQIVFLHLPLTEWQAFFASVWIFGRDIWNFTLGAPPGKVVRQPLLLLPLKK